MKIDNNFYVKSTASQAKQNYNETFKSQSRTVVCIIMHARPSSLKIGMRGTTPLLNIQAMRHKMHKHACLCANKVCNTLRTQNRGLICSPPSEIT